MRVGKNIKLKGTIYTRDEDPDPDPDPVGSVDFWAVGYDPDPLLFSTDPDPAPDPDPTCNNEYIQLFSGKFLNKSETSYWWTAVTII